MILCVGQTICTAVVHVKVDMHKYFKILCGYYLTCTMVVNVVFLSCIWQFSDARFNTNNYKFKIHKFLLDINYRVPNFDKNLKGASK